MDTISGLVSQAWLCQLLLLWCGSGNPSRTVRDSKQLLRTLLQSKHGRSGWCLKLALLHSSIWVAQMCCSKVLTRLSFTWTMSCCSVELSDTYMPISQLFASRCASLDLSFPFSFWRRFQNEHFISNLLGFLKGHLYSLKHSTVFFSLKNYKKYQNS